MGQSEVIQIKADEDGCVYLYNVATDAWQKLCDIEAGELPESVRNAVRKMYLSIYR
jgi:hypothetical protein